MATLTWAEALEQLAENEERARRMSARQSFTIAGMQVKWIGSIETWWVGDCDGDCLQTHPKYKTLAEVLTALEDIQNEQPVAGSRA